jgi:hypothetical protein
MKPTKGTYWFYLNARTEGASASACIRVGAYGLARCHANRAKDYWLMVEWEQE